MFDTQINDLTILGEPGRAATQHLITGYDCLGTCDNTMEATLRVLLAERKSTLKFDTNISSLSAQLVDSYINDNNACAIVTHICGSNSAANQLFICVLNGDQQSKNSTFIAFERGMHRYNKDYTRLKDVEQYLIQSYKMNVNIYTSTAKKRTIVIVDRMPNTVWHLIQSAIPRLIPWVFDEKPLTDSEIVMLKSLSGDSSEEYVSAIEEITERLNFRELFIREKLEKFESRFVDDRIEKISNDIYHAERDIDDYIVTLKSLYEKLDMLRATECGLRCQKAEMSESSELLEYFIRNKNLILKWVSDEEISFVVTSVIVNYDPDVFSKCIKNGNSFFYKAVQGYGPDKYENNEMSADRIERLMRAIFETERLKLRVCAAFNLNCGHKNVSPLRGYDYGRLLSSYIPNQHIDVYRCISSFRDEIVGALRNNDIISAIEACIGSCQTINLTEANTGTFFMHKILAKDVGEIIQMPDGSTKTPLEAVIWLENEENNKEVK